MKLKCYITGDPVSDNATQYVFGNKIVIPLTQKSFAEFVLRAHEDYDHNIIVDYIIKLVHKRDLLLSNIEDIINDDEVPEPGVQLQLFKVENQLYEALLDKAVSGIRILNDLRAEHKDK